VPGFTPLAAWGLALALLVGAPRAGAAQVTVEDLEVHMNLARNRTTIGRVIPVRNDEARAQQVRVIVADWYRDSLGRNVFVDAGEVAESCSQRLRVFPTEFQIAPGATEQVRVTYDPLENDPGCWSIVMVETVTPPSANATAQGSFLTIEIRTGVKIYVHVPEPVRAGEIESADVELTWQRADSTGQRSDSVQVREAVVRFANTGTAHLRVRSTLEIRDADARLLHTISGAEIPMTPNAKVDIHLAMPRTLASGQYIAVVLLDFGGAEITAAQVDFRVP